MFNILTSYIIYNKERLFNDIVTFFEKEFFEKIETYYQNKLLFITKVCYYISKYFKQYPMDISTENNM